MKKLIIITLAILYLLFSAGVVLSSHFCNGRFDTVSLLTKKQCCPDSDSPGSCCQNLTSFFKIKDIYDSERSTPYVHNLTLTAEPNPFANNFGSYHEMAKVGTFAIHPQKVNGNTPVYILNRVLII